MEPAAKKSRMSKVTRVKNKMPAEIQITAEQLLQEAEATKMEKVPPPPRQKVTDPAELADLQVRKRKEFEDNIRKNRTAMTNWIKYAKWEESQQDLERSRSVYERAIDVDHRNIPIWTKYAEMEMRHKQINHARNLWDRAITILPRANQFWYKYTYMEEMLGNVPGARQVFERWMEWEPEEQAWLSYIKMELRYKEVERARHIYERFVQVHPETKNWIRYARFEEQNGFLANARNIFERATEFFEDLGMDEKLYIAFAKFEEGCREYERARTIFKFSLDHIQKDEARELFKAYTHFEKKYGDRAGIEDVIISKRKFQYEEEIKANPMNYEAWFDYIRLMEAEGSREAICEVYERAIANVPLSMEKKFWRRYIYLWIYYAIYEELVAKDMERTRAVYKACLEIIPHKTFTFAKIWLMYAQFEIRQKNLSGARKVLGTSIGKCPKPKVFKGYIELELQLREFDRCRKLYAKFLMYGGSSCQTWINFAELETILGDIDRARAIYELAVKQPTLDVPELLWKSYISFETELEEYDKVRDLYGRLLERTQHVKVWLNLANFEMSLKTDSLSNARKVYEKADKSLKNAEGNEERAMFLEAWLDFEKENGDANSLQTVEKKMPKKVKRKRKIYHEDGSSAGWEEYWDYVFPDDEIAAPSIKLLEMARMWKHKQATGEEEDEEEDGDEDDEEEEDEEEDEDEEGENDEVQKEEDNDGEEDDNEDEKRAKTPANNDNGTDSE